MDAKRMFDAFVDLMGQSLLNMDDKSFLEIIHEELQQVAEVVEQGKSIDQIPEANKVVLGLQIKILTLRMYHRNYKEAFHKLESLFEDDISGETIDSLRDKLHEIDKSDEDDS